MSSINQSTALEKTKAKDLKTVLNEIRPQLQRVLPAGLSADVHIQAVLNAVAADEKLAKCTPMSIALAAAKAATLGLRVDIPNEANLVPYARNIAKRGEPDRWIDECKFSPGYEGWIKLAYQSGLVKSIRCQVVGVNDKFEVHFDDDDIHFTHTPNVDDQGAFRLVYSITKLTNGERFFEWKTKKEIDALRAMSRTPMDKQFNWIKSYNQMALAKIARYACKRIPKGETNLANYVDKQLESIDGNPQLAGVDFVALGAPSDLPALPPAINITPEKPAGSGRQAQANQPAEQPAIDVEPEPDSETHSETQDAREKLKSQVADLHAALSEKDKNTAPLRDIEAMSLIDLQDYHLQLELQYDTTSKPASKSRK